MRILTSLVFSVSLLAACGDDGGSGGTTDGGGSDSGQQDSNVPPVANCTALDLASAPTVTIMNAMVTPNAQGGALTAGTYKLTSVKLYASGVPVSGTAKARVEIVTGNATSGAARVALNIEAMALGNPIQNDTTAAGLYTLAGSALNLTEGCGGDNPLSGLTYTATATSLTLWTNYMLTDPITLNIPIELVLAHE